MKALFELFRRFDARRIFGFIRRLGGMSRPKVKCYDLRSTHALRVEGDGYVGSAMYTANLISIHALRVEGDGKAVCRYHVTQPISIHALRVEGDPLRSKFRRGGRISIHALRVEGDFRRKSRTWTMSYFYPRPPGGGRLLYKLRQIGVDVISIHALRVEGDFRASRHSQL